VIGAFRFSRGFLHESHSGMFTCHVSCYPWDLLDEGIDRVLDRLQDQVGAGGLMLVACCDELEQFRPHPDAEPRIYRTSGGVYFHPNADTYQATRLKPPLWEQHRKMDALAKISERCADRQLDLRLSLSPLHSRRLIGKHPEIACKNAWDIPSRSALCPANPDVQEYLAALFRDLSVYDDVSGIVLDAVEWPAATDLLPDMDAMATLGQHASALLRLCFCESCLQRAGSAGIDAQAAKRCTFTLLDRLCRAGHPDDRPLEDILDGQPPLEAFVQWSDAALVDLIERLKGASTKALLIDLQSASRGFLELRCAAAILALADRIMLDLDDLEQAVGAISQGEALCGALTPSFVQSAELLLRMDEGFLDEAPEVVRQITWAAEAGVAGTTVTHYGAVLDNQFAWIHRGLRNARRLSTL